MCNLAARAACGGAVDLRLRRPLGLHFLELRSNRRGDRGDDIVAVSFSERRRQRRVAGLEAAETYENFEKKGCAGEYRT